MATRNRSRSARKQLLKTARNSRARMKRRPSRGPTPFADAAWTGLEALEQRLLLSAMPTAVGWLAQGPGPTLNGQVEGMGGQDNPVSGAVHTVAAHPTNANVLYLGAANGGVWKTTNATASSPDWTPLTDFEDSLSIGALEFDPTDLSNQTLVAGIGRVSSFFRVGGNQTGLLRTTDGGANWQELGQTDLAGTNISGVGARGTTILVSANTVGSGTNPGVYLSDNDGLTFNNISGLNNLPNGSVADLVGDPGNPDRFYAAVTRTGIYRTDNATDPAGPTWTNVTDAAIGALLSASTSNVEIAVHNNNGAGTNAVYVGIVNNGQLAGVFRSPDQGATWTAMDIPQLLGGSFPVTNATNATPIVITSAGHGLASANLPRVRITGATGNTAANGNFAVTVINPNQFSLNGSAGNGNYTGNGNWSKITGIQPRPKPGGQGAIHFSILADPSNADLVYVGGDRQDFPNPLGAGTFSGRLFRGNAGILAGGPGAIPSPQWTPLTHTGTSSDSSPHADSREMVFDANGDIIETDDGGIYRQTNPTSGSGDWVSVIGDLQVAELHDVAWDSLSNVLIGGAQDTGTPQQTATGSTTWDSVTVADGGDVAVDNISLAGSDQSIRYASTQNLGGFTRRTYDDTGALDSTDSVLLNCPGCTTALMPGTGGNAQFVTPLALNAIDPVRLLIGGSAALYESTMDRGDTISDIAALLNINAMVYGGRSGGVDNEEVLFVGSGAQVFSRTAAAPAPVTATSALPVGAGTILDIVLDPADWQNVFTIDGNQVFMTDDAGADWDDITGDLTATNLQTVNYIPNPVAGFDAIVVGAREGVFATTTTLLDSTTIPWLELGSDLANALVWDSDYDAGDDVLVAGTMGRGAWTLFNARAAVTGDLRGTVWGDLNGDGIDDVGEFGIPNVTVNLYDSATNALVATDLTNAGGTYVFTGLVPDDYYLEFIEPLQHAISPQDQGADDDLDSDADRTTGLTGTVTVLPGGLDTSVDAGMLVPDRFEQNDSFAAAADLGVLPGVHINQLTISQRSVQGNADPPDDDFFTLELLRPDDVDVSISFEHDFGDLNLQVLDGTGAVLGASTGTTDTETVSLTGLAAGTYVVRVFGAGGDVNVYDIAMDPGATSTTRLFYVNDADTANDFYTQAVGNDANDGLTPLTPKLTVQSLLDNEVLTVTDLVVIDTGTYSDTVRITKSDESAAYAGAPHTGGGAGSRYTNGGTRWELTDADFQIFFKLTFAGSLGGTGIYAHEGVADPSTNNVIRDSMFPGTATAIRIDDGDTDLIHDNLITGAGSFGVDVNNGVSVTIRDNVILDRAHGVWTTTPTAVVTDNEIEARSNGLVLAGSGNVATASGNTISLATQGVNVSSATATIFDNELFSNTNGILSNTLNTVAFGNDIHLNTTGIRGFGTFGGTDWSAGQPNDIHDNTTGIFADNNSTVRFNEIHHNTTGVQVDDAADVHHNVLYRNIGEAVLVATGNVVTITNNTIYTPTGDGVRLTSASKNVTLRNNIIWTEDGFDLNVDTDSQVGFDSDYNNLFATGGVATSRPVFWQKPFADLFDWQVEANFDNNSIGYTVPDPFLDDPMFVDLPNDDYHLTDTASTSIDGGDPLSLFGNEPAPAGGRINLGAYGNTVEAALSKPAYVEIDAPNFYTDLQDDVGQVVLWHTFDDSELTKELAGDVDIDLIEVGFGKVADIAVVPATDGSVGWTPLSLDPPPGGVAGDISKRYRVRITSVAKPAVLDSSREPFSIVPDGDEFYVDDDDNTNDQYTPAAIGNNRNTGQSPADPKAVLLAMLRSYDLGPGDSVFIDTGDYIHVRNTIISGAPGVGDDEGARYTGPNPAEPGFVGGMVATIDRANPFAGSTNIELNDADFVALQYLTLVGAEDGLIVQNGSTNFSGDHLIVSHNVDDGVSIASDSQFTTLDSLTAFNNGGDGISVATAISALRDSRAYDNGDVGFRLTNQSGVVLEQNEAYNNNVGIALTNTTSGTPVQSVIGNPDLTLSLGNIVHDNRTIGIDTANDVLVVGNSVFGHFGNNDIGIDINGGEARHNVVHDNFNGIRVASSGTAAFNRVYHNINHGIRAGSFSVISGNVIYSNAVGVEARNVTTSAGWRGLVENNVIYDNTSYGIGVKVARSSGATHGRIYNNTVYQPTGDAVRVTNGSIDVELNSNILETQAAGSFDIFVADDSQIGFTSDLNDLFISGGGQVGSWQGVDRPTLNAWQNAGFTDENSISQDPQFVDVDGPNNVLGFSGAPLGPPPIFVDDAAAALVGAWTAAPGSGFGGSHHQHGAGTGSDTATWSFAGLPVGTYEVAATWVVPGSGNATDAVFEMFDGATLRAVHQEDQRFAPDDFTDGGASWERLATVVVTGGTLDVRLSDQANARVIADAIRIEQIGGDHGTDDDFHLKSTEGRFVGSLVPVHDAATRLPVFLPPPVELTDAVQSPAIDRGDAAFDFNKEPTPNGNFINMGGYGDTTQASKSPAEYVLVTKPDGGEVWPADQTFPIRWRSDILDPTTFVPDQQATYAAEVMTEAPFGYWQLDDSGSTAVDVSGNLNSGTYENNVTQNVAGFLLNNDAAEFDGTNARIVVPDDATLNPTAISVEAWIRPDTGSGTFDSVLSKSSSSAWTDGYGLFFDSNTNNIIFFVNSWSSVRVQAPVTLDQWQHVAGTYSVADGELRLYVNGVQLDTFTYSSAINHTNNNLQIGQGTGSNTYTWTGRLDEVAVYGAALSAADVLDHLNAGLGTPTFVDVELIRDGDPAFNLPIDSSTLNDGEVQWLIDGALAPPNTDYRVRVTRTDNVALTDDSNGPFEITAPISTYYVDDTDVANTDDQYTPAAHGDPTNSGLSPTDPKASIRGVLETYDLKPGDVILVDTGVYTLSTNIIVTDEDTGAAGMPVLIQGPTIAGREAVLDRANTATGSYVFELVNADWLTIDHLSITGGVYGVYADTSSGSDNVTISNNRVFGNSSIGIWLHTSNDDAQITLNDVTMNGSTGIGSDGTGSMVTFNTVHDQPDRNGIVVTGTGTTVSNNIVYGTSTGISVSGVGSNAANQTVLDMNTAFDNSNIGISAGTNVLLTNNTAYGNTSIGINVSTGQVFGSTVYDNNIGLQITGVSLAETNRAFHNASIGIRTGAQTTTRGNFVYDNPTGINGENIVLGARWRGLVENNVVYDNSARGIFIENSNIFGGGQGSVSNNTVYQRAGNAVRVTRNAMGLDLRNNILSVDAGFDIVVDSNSQVEFMSDYNLLQTRGAGAIADWGGFTFTDRIDWSLELGFDGNSLAGAAADPMFFDIDGADNILGFSTTTMGAPAIVDDGDAGFATTGAWTPIAGSSGFGADHQENAAGTGTETATWTFAGLMPGTYEVAATWVVPGSGNASDARYHIFDTSDVVAFEKRNQRVAPNDFPDAGVNWENLATVVISSPTLVVELSDKANGRVIADAVRIQRIEGDHGGDDDFHVMSTSPAIDKGDPLSYWFAEPMPNGGRANAGAYGNTADAALSPAELVQVLDPNGFEKFEEGQQVLIEWRSSGLTEVELVGRVNAGGNTVQDWLFHKYQTDGTTPTSFTSAVDTSMVSDPAPVLVYQQYARAATGIGNKLTFDLPLSDGTYDVVLHFAEPSTNSVGTRVFDIEANGALEVDDMDIRDTAGARFKATTVAFPVTTSLGAGLTLDLVNETATGAILSGIQITKMNAGGVANPTVDLDLSIDSGGTFPISIATSQGMDMFGRGSVLWPAGPETGSNTAVVRASANDLTMPTDTSDEPFLIANDGTDYYVNDTDPTLDEHTLALGDNRNSGKDPDEPMASIRALLAAYDIDPDDTIFLDTGTYTLLRNVLIESADAGAPTMPVTVQGPLDLLGLGAEAVLDRANTATGSYVVELENADHVTIDHVSMTGGIYGVYASNLSDSDNVVVSNNRVFNNSSTGIWIRTGNDDAIITGNDVTMNGSTGIDSDGPRATVTFNTVHDQAGRTGIAVSGAASTVTDNIAYGTSAGISVGGVNSGGQTVIERNTTFDNTSTGLVASTNVLVQDNTSYGNTSFGINVSNGRVFNNTVYDNSIGLRVTGTSLAESNRAFHNSSIGIHSGAFATTRHNVAYGNSTGINGENIATSARWRGLIENNLVYANSNHGIRIENPEPRGRVFNNTVFQSIGDALRVHRNETGLTVRNNILWVENGFDIFVDGASQVGFDSDYNLLRATSSGVLAQWGTTVFTDLADWVHTLGRDANSLAGSGPASDPLFVDIDGADDILGFSLSNVGAPVIIDDGAAGFSPPAAWTAAGTGFGGNHHQHTAGTGTDTATWTFGVVPGTYEVAATWVLPAGTNATDARYEILDGTDVVAFERRNQRAAPNDFTDAGADWENLATVVITGPTLTVRLSDKANGRVIADAIRIQAIGGDHSADDDFHLLTASPAIDRGDPLSHWLGEPMPNGDRVNLGRYGNTNEATTSPTELVHLLEPNGFEKFEVGDQVLVQWQSAGLTQQALVARMNSGGHSVQDWLFDKYQTIGTTPTSFASAVDTSMVSDPAPQLVYQQYARATNGVGNMLTYDLPLPDGTFNVSLHFVEPSTNTVGVRVFDIVANGAPEADDYDIRAAAGARFKAITFDFPVTTSLGNGLVLDLVNETASGAVLSGIQITKPNPGGVADPTVDLALSTDSGTTFPTTIATAATMDAFGRGSFLWTASPVTGSNTASIRATANDLSMPADESDNTFLIANNGTDYFVNIPGDPDPADNEHTSAPGDNANDGKTMGTPMASLAALLHKYDLDPGDTIFVDTGTYTLLQNVLIDGQDAGVTVQGPVLAGREALLDRANTAASSYVVELVDADGVLIDNVSVTGGIHGAYADNLSNSDGVTIQNGRVFDTTSTAIWLRTSNDDATIDNMDVTDYASTGIDLDGARPIVTSNTVYDDPGTTGISVSGVAATVSLNTVHNVQTGISASNSPGGAVNQTVVDTNTVFDNSSIGISVSGNVLVTGNDVSGQLGTNDVGISASDVGISASSALVTGNNVHNNYYGVRANGRTVAESNRVFNNTRIGIFADAFASILSNFVYSNSVGILGDRVSTSSPYRGLIQNNLVYDNSNQGIVVQRGGASGTVHPRVFNNTVFQEVGDAVRVQSTSQNVKIRNNILWVEAGFDIFVGTNSQVGLDSDYNQFNQGVDPNAQVGFYNNAGQDMLADWQLATGLDTHSREGDPLFVDHDGADNVLGFTSTGGGFDGGPDDNFIISAGSPVIDRADSFAAPEFDIEGFPRVDDPGTPNTGTPDYTETILGASLFSATGTVRNWRADNSWWTLNFAGGFTFPYYGVVYNAVNVTSNGFLQFADTTNITDSSNSFSEFIQRVRIAPMWDDLSTAADPGDNIFVDDSLTDRVTIRWDATNQADGSDVNVAVTLIDTGTIQFHYGPGNTNLTPTVGLADGHNFLLSTYDNVATLTDAATAEFTLIPGAADVGAYEFRGSSFDVTPPTVAATLPIQIDASDLSNASINQIQVTFSEIVNNIDANAPANYDLRNPGPNGSYDDGDDDIYNLVPNFTTGFTQVTLNVTGGPLPDGDYRLTIKGDTLTNSGIHDLAGLLLDGDNNGSEGPDYVRLFQVDATPPVVTATAPPEVDAGGLVTTSLDQIDVSFNEALNVGDATAAANYELRSPGPNGTYDGGGDDVVYALNPSYTPLSTVVSLDITAGPLPAGDYRLTILSDTGTDSGIHDLAGSLLDGDDNGSEGPDYVRFFEVDAGMPPTITEVLVLGPWTPAYLTHLQTTGQGTGGLSIPDGSAAQLTPIHLGNVERVILRFSEDVVIPAGAIEMTGVLGPDGVLNATVDYSFTVATQTGVTGQFEAVLSLSQPLAIDKLLVKVDGTTASAVTNLSGTALDGEWTDTTDTYPSGDGSAGGNFHFRMNSLPGDIDGDSFVADPDLAILLGDFGKGPPMPLANSRADLTGDLTVGDSDLAVLLSNFGKGLPAGTPAAPVTAPAPGLAPAAATGDASEKSQVDLITNASSQDTATDNIDDDATSKRKARRAARRQRMRAWMASAGLETRRARRLQRGGPLRDVGTGLQITDDSPGDLIESLGKPRLRRAWRLGSGASNGRV